MTKFVWGLLALVLLLNSEGCRRRQLTQTTTPPVAPTMSTDTVVPVRKPISLSLRDSTQTRPTRPGIEEARALVAEIDFVYLKAKSKLSFKSKDESTENANVNIHVRKDSLIWLSISKIGIEGVRVMINRDTITVMDRQARTYAKYDFPTLSRQFNFDMDFDLLQALIVGNLPLPKQPAQRVVRNERDYLLLRQAEGKVMVDNYIGETDRKLKRLILSEQPTKNTLRLDYDDFATLNNSLFPFTSLVTLDYKAGTDGQFYQTVLRIKHNKVELTEKDPGFPFTIPTNYQRRP
jgi:hypothetical protein